MKTITLKKHVPLELELLNEDGEKTYIIYDDQLGRCDIIPNLELYARSLLDEEYGPSWNFDKSLHNSIVYNNMIYAAIYELNKLDPNEFDVHLAINDLLDRVFKKESTDYFCL